MRTVLKKEENRDELGRKAQKSFSKYNPIAKHAPSPTKREGEAFETRKIFDEVENNETQMMAIYTTLLSEFHRKTGALPDIFPAILLINVGLSAV